MTASEILVTLSEHMVQVWVEDNRLCFDALKGSLTAELRSLIETNEEGLVKELTNQSQSIISVYPLSFNQRFLWILHQLAPQSAAYNIAFVARVVSTIDASAALAAIRKLIDRHPLLRSTYSNKGGYPYLHVHSTMEPDFEHVEAGNWTEEELCHMVQEKYATPFDLTNGPVLCVHLFTVSEGNHILMFTSHYIACDGNSMRILITEFLQECISDSVVELPPVKSEYSDYIRRQIAMLNQEESQKMLAFWTKNLSGELPYLNLPTDKQRAASLTHSGSTFHFKLDIKTYRECIGVSEKEGVTLYTFLLAAFQVLLKRYCSQDDILVGTPMDTRNSREYESTIGCFVNPVVVRGDLSGDPTFSELLARTQKAVEDAVENKEYPFSMIVDKLHPSRDLSRSPIFQVLFNFSDKQNLGSYVDFFYREKKDASSFEEIDFGDLKLKPYALNQEEGQIDLDLEMIDNGLTLTGAIKYNKDLFEQATIARMAENFKTLLSSILKEPSRPLSELEIISDAERRKSLIEWNDNDIAHPGTNLLHELFESQVEQAPESVAVECEGVAYSYRELNDRSNQLAHHLKSLEVGPESIVGIFMERSVDMLVALLGILKSGGAFLPLDPKFPESRLSYMIDHSQVSVLLTQQQLKDKLPCPVSSIICLDSDWQDVTHHSRENLHTTVGPDTLAYVIYTSGSTGKPKGVQIEHDSVVSFLMSMSRQPGLTENDILLAVTTISFDISILELFLPISVGAKTIILSRSVASDGKQLLRTIESSGATVLQATPSTYRLLIAAGWNDTSNLKILVGGEALPNDLARELVRRSKNVWNMYGPTEATIWITCYRLIESEDVISIGRPLANTQIYILDHHHLQPVPIGVPGELHLGGVQVARGYLGRPDLTAEKFISDPFSKNIKARLYKTGDLARYLPDGNIEFLGRIDTQVKVRGFRIELGEIETFLTNHQQVREAVVMAREDTFGSTELIGYVLPVQGALPTIESLHSFLRNELPEYMVPGKYVFMDSFPLTPNGKVDRKALPEPDKARPATEHEYVAPSNTCEKKISEIWCKVLRLDKVGINDNFFDLGGNSLLSLQVIDRVQQEFGVDLSVTKLFQYPTVTSFAKELEQSPEDQSSFLKVEVRAKSRRKAMSRRRRQKIKEKK